MIQVVCYKCQTKEDFPGRVGFREECESCGEDLHICYNCRFYDKTAYNECREPAAEVVLEKARANRCEFFEPGSGSASANKADQLMSAAEALFKKK